MGPIQLLQNPVDVDREIDRITGLMHEARNHANNPLPPRHTHGRLPPHIRELIHRKNRSRRTYQNTLAPEDRILKNQLQREVAQAILEFRNNTWDHKLQELPDMAQGWKIKKALGRKDLPVMPPIYGVRGMAYSDQEKAEAFALNLGYQYSPITRNTDVEFTDRVDAMVSRYLRTTPPLDHNEPTNPEEVRDIIHGIHGRKSPGKDGINCHMLKNLPQKGVMSLINIFNVALRLMYFLSTWKEAIGVHIKKPQENSTFHQNYMPISLLSILGKVFEHIMKNRIQKLVDLNDVLPQEQYGFRAGHSTTDQLTRLTTQATEGFNRRWQGPTPRYIESFR